MTCVSQHGGASCLSTLTGNGEQNKIDNNGGNQDVIRLDFGAIASGLGGVDPIIPLAGSYRHLYVTTSTGSGDDDFLLRSATGSVPIPPSSVPEPASLALLATGLAGLAGAGA